MDRTRGCGTGYQCAYGSKEQNLWPVPQGLSMLQCLPFEAFSTRWLDSYREAWEREASPSSEELAFFDEALRRSGSILFAAYDERFLGHAACESRGNEKEAFCQLRVLPSLVSRSVEDLLLSSVLDLAVFRESKRIHFLHSSDATPSTDFFLRTGGTPAEDGSTIVFTTPSRARRLDTMGSFIDALIVTNIQMWHVQEQIYEPEIINALTKTETLHLLHRGTWLNLERNRCMDGLDSSLCGLLLPTRPDEENPTEPLQVLLERSRTAFHDFTRVTQADEQRYK
jgi:hypothetical protein